MLHEEYIDKRKRPSYSLLRGCQSSVPIFSFSLPSIPSSPSPSSLQPAKLFSFPCPKRWFSHICFSLKALLNLISLHCQIWKSGPCIVATVPSFLFTSKPITIRLQFTVIALLTITNGLLIIKFSSSPFLELIVWISSKCNLWLTIDVKINANIISFSGQFCIKYFQKRLCCYLHYYSC